MAGVLHHRSKPDNYFLKLYRLFHKVRLRIIFPRLSLYCTGEGSFYSVLYTVTPHLSLYGEAGLNTSITICYMAYTFTMIVAISIVFSFICFLRRLFILRLFYCKLCNCCVDAVALHRVNVHSVELRIGRRWE